MLCKDLALDFKSSGFQTRVATTMSYDEHTNFTEGNITTYLSELEEYLASLIAYTAHKKGDPNASVASVPFNNLNTSRAPFCTPNVVRSSPFLSLIHI